MAKTAKCQTGEKKNAIKRLKREEAESPEAEGDRTIIITIEETTRGGEKGNRGLMIAKRAKLV
jgi:hypothetical protein